VTPFPELTVAAGEYLALGLRVIALSGKTPNTALHKHWRDDLLVGEPESEEDWAFIDRFFSHPETTGIGIVIDYPFVVVDIDGEEGAVQWRDLVGVGEVPDRWVAKTGRGLHLWYGSITPTGTIKLGSKLDLKAQGGYVAAPPSKHPDGGTYEWLWAPGAEAPMEAPEPLARRIEDHAYDLRSSMEAKQTRALAYGPRFKSGDTVFYAQASHDALFEGMKAAVEGNRNNYLHWAAATLAEENGTEEEFEQLAAIAIDCGLDRVEVVRTLRSARTRG
jgi:hypothetical protein